MLLCHHLEFGQVKTLLCSVVRENWIPTRAVFTIDWSRLTYQTAQQRAVSLTPNLCKPVKSCIIDVPYPVPETIRVCSIS
jgi:hypothetical protein